MNRIRSYSNAKHQQRQVTCLKKARRCMRYAAGYLNKLLAEFDGASARKRHLLSKDVSDLLRKACRFVKQSQKAGPRSKHSP